VVLAAHDVGDAGIEVVDEVREHIQHRAVGAGDNEVVHARVREPDLPPDDVVEHGLTFVGDAQANRPRLLFDATEPLLESVPLLEQLDVVGGRVRVVGVA
jgi:hypothetical protein